MVGTYGGVTDGNLGGEEEDSVRSCKCVPIFLEGMGERSKRSQRSAIDWLIDPKISSEAANPL